MSEQRPRVALWLLRRLADPEIRDWLVADVARRHGQLARRHGRLSAGRWLWRQVLYAATARGGAPAPPETPRKQPMSIAGFFANLARDVRFSSRELFSKHPLPTAVAALTLALGIGANTAIFSVLNVVLMRPLPFADADELAMIWRDTARGETTWISVAEFLDYRDDLAPVLEVAAFTDQNVNLTGGEEPRRVLAGAVSSNYFDVLGVEARIGRTFVPTEEGADVAPLALIGEGLWRRAYGADPELVGGEIVVNGTARTVIGVLPADLRLPIDYRDETITELYVPLPYDRSNVTQRGDRGWHAVGRLTDGTSLPAARQALDALHKRWHEQGLFGSGEYTAPGLVGIEPFLFGEVRPMLLTLAAAASLVLLIACSNVASLMLARGEARRREIGVRVALGAGRSRVVGQVLTESMLLALFGGALALALTAGVLGLVRRWGPAYVPRLAEVGADGSLLAIALGVSVVTGVLFGILPAAHAAGAQPRDLLAASAQRFRQRRQTVRRGLLVGELALAVMLAIGAMLMVRSFVYVRAIELGFDPSNVLTLRLELPGATYPDSVARGAFWADVVREIGELAGVETVGAARRLPLASRMGDWSITIEGRDRAPGENPNGDFQVVMPGYFEAIGAELVRGRLLATSDRADAVPVVVVSESMAAMYWPDQDAIGKRFRIGDEQTPWYEIVGVVRDMKHNTVLEEPRTEMYHAVPQWALAAGVPGGMSLVIRTRDDPRAIVDAVRRRIGSLDAGLPVADVRTLEDIVATATADTRFATGLLGTFGGVALLLAATGIYGVVSYSVRRRRREIGIRMAIGAARRRVLAEEIGEMLGALGMGLAVGIAGAMALGGSIAGLLVGVDPYDPLSYAIVVATVAAVTLASAALPARRAAATDPLVALRGD